MSVLTEQSETVNLLGQHAAYPPEVIHLLVRVVRLQRAMWEKRFGWREQERQRVAGYIQTAR